MAGGVLLWERDSPIRLHPTRESGRSTKSRTPLPYFTANFAACLEISGGPRASFRAADATDRYSIGCRNERGDLVDKNLALPWNLALAPTAGPGEDQDVGSPS